MMCGLLVGSSRSSAGAGHGSEKVPLKRAPASLALYGAKIFALRQPDGRTEFTLFLVCMAYGRAQNEKISRMSEAFGLKSIASHATDELPWVLKQRLALRHHYANHMNRTFCFSTTDVRR